MAKSHLYPQAFRIGRVIYGLQFHPEITEGMIRQWLASDKTPLEDRILQQLPLRLPETQRLFILLMKTYLSPVNL